MFDLKCDCQKKFDELNVKFNNYKYVVDKATVEMLVWKLRDANIVFPVEFIEHIVKKINEMQLKKPN